MDKIELIQNSLRCFWCGAAGCFPVLGLPLAVQALSKFFKTSRTAAGQWNPARPYLLWGGTLGAAGVLISALCFVLVGLIIIHHVSSPSD